MVKKHGKHILALVPYVPYLYLRLFGLLNYCKKLFFGKGQRVFVRLAKEKHIVYIKVFYLPPAGLIKAPDKNGF